MNIISSDARRIAARTLTVACTALALVASAQAQGHGPRGGGGHVVHGGGQGYHDGHHGPRYRPGWVWGGVGLGLGLGLASYYAWPWYGYADPGYVVVDAPVGYANPQPVYASPVPARSASRPVIYPRNGQSAAQTDADADACSQWAGQQPNATADAGVFERGISACMDARGYTLR
jgi:hypothetical protein